jgi:hypothetical protein
VDSQVGHQDSEVLNMNPLLAPLELWVVQEDNSSSIAYWHWDRPSAIRFVVCLWS